MSEILFLMEESILSPETAVMLSVVLIIFSALTTWLYAKKNRLDVYIVCRDCLFKKIGWLTSLLLGVAMYYVINSKIIIFFVALSCVTNEFKKIMSNLSHLGVNIDFENNEKGKMLDENN